MKSVLSLRLFVKLLFAAPLFAGLIQLTEHHWPAETAWVEFIVVMIALGAFEYVVKLMERQSALLEQVLGVLKADRHEYEEPLEQR